MNHNKRTLRVQNQRGNNLEFDLRFNFKEKLFQREKLFKSYDNIRLYKVLATQIERTLPANVIFMK
jgi:hypothetical protein